MKFKVFMPGYSLIYQICNTCKFLALLSRVMNWLMMVISNKSIQSTQREGKQDTCPGNWNTMLSSATIPEERNILQWVFYLKIKESYFDMCNSIKFLRVYIVSLSFISRETLSLSIIIIKKNFFSTNKWNFTKMLNEMNVLLFTCKFDIVWSTHSVFV